jgi:hypothetical protein
MPGRDSPFPIGNFDGDKDESGFIIRMQNKNVYKIKWRSALQNWRNSLLWKGEMASNGKSRFAGSNGNGRSTMGSDA